MIKLVFTSFVAGTILYSAAAFAVPTQEEVGQIPAPEVSQKTELRGVSVVALYSAANSTTDHYSRTGSNDLSLSNGGAWGVGAGYKDIHHEGFGWSLLGAYESMRTFTGGSFSDGFEVSQSWINKGRGFSMVEFEGSGTYGFRSPVYLLGGVNYPFVFTKNIGGDNTGNIGFQGGVGYNIDNRFSLEGLYRTINFNVSYTNATSDAYALNGFVIRGGYTFN